MNALGYVRPPDQRHRALFAVSAVANLAAAPPPGSVEVVLPVPTGLVDYMDQGREGACVGASCTWVATLLNSTSASARQYDFNRLYRAAQASDGLNIQSGTTTRAGLEELRLRGHWPIVNGSTRPRSRAEGIQAYRWAETIQEIRALVAQKIPGVLGCDWYWGYDEPTIIDDEPWCCPDGRRGQVRGGHAICVAGWSDERDACLLLNSWGRRWGRVRCFRAWWPIPELFRQLQRNGAEYGIVTDR